MVRFTNFLLTITASFIWFTTSAQNFPPPRNLQFDTLTLVATWEAPRRVMLDEHFEGTVFPPANWQDTTQGMGWFATENGSSAGFSIPPHATYAVVNNELAGTGNNGCCDYLITPQMDFSQDSSYTLSFNSFFRGWGGETATVEISTDGGNTWNLLLEVLPHFTWATLTIDLSPYSGSNGSQHVQLAFKASDNGIAGATGWAIDDVVVMSEELEVDGYMFFLDGTLFGLGGDTTITFDPDWFPSGFFQYFCVAAVYDSGYSDGVCANFPAYYLKPPQNLEAVINGSTTSIVAILTWQPPSAGDEKTDSSYLPATATGNPAEVSTEISSFYPNAASVSRSTDATVLFNNGTIINSAGTGPGGTDESIIPAAGSSFGFHFGQSAGSSVAEDFDVFETWTINSVEFQGYQTFSGTTSSFTGVYFRIYDGKPGEGGNVIWGDLTTNRLSEATFANIYRVDAPGQGTDRPIMNLICNDLNIELNPGTYWIEWQASGSLSSGPWVPNTVEPGNAIQWNNSSWSPLTNPGTVGLPFILKGTDGSGSANLLSYNIYRNNSFLVNVPRTATVYWDILEAPGTYCYDVSAVYDLTEYGFPGQIGESQPEGPACVENTMMQYLPFDEDWTTGQFDNNLWTAGENWVMDGGNGNPAPSAKFSSLPTLTNYSSNLVSFHMYSGAGKTATPYCVWLSFDYLLDDISASGTEKLTIEIENGDTWTTLKEFTNTGDVSWTTEKININPFATNIPFRIRFNVNGANSELISHWLVDNIKIYNEYSFIPVANLSAENTGNPQQNDIQLSWDVPEWEEITELIQDDNSWEIVLTINPGYSGWLGNKFTTGAGELRNVDIMWLNNNSNNPVVLDIFDGNHALIGSSESFVPVPGNWQTITIPALNVEGDFYTMVRFDGQWEKKDFLGMDITAPTGRPNNGWFFDGVNWSQMDAFGYPECVFLIRATLSVHKNCEDGDSHSKSKSLNSAGNNNLDSRNRNSIKSATGYTGLSHYDLYRREYTIPVAGQDSLLTEWQKIASPTTNSLLDQNLDFKCYQYYVEAMYNEGSSGPSEIAEECFFVGMDDLQTTSAKLYPNPASDFLTIEINTPIDNITVYNSTGILVEEVNLSVVSENSLEKKIRFDVSNFPTGIYSLKFTTAKGESFSRKFVKM
jgi:hypothetical protein